MNLSNFLIEDVFESDEEKSILDYSLINNNILNIISLNEFNDVNTCYPFTSKKLANSTLNNIKFEITKNNNNAKKRKDKEDNIRKKIKSGFLKKLRNIINNLLKNSGSKYTFESLPLHFIEDISKKTNFEVMNLTYEEIFNYTYHYTYQKIINDEKKELEINIENKIDNKKELDKNKKNKVNNKKELDKNIENNVDKKEELRQHKIKKNKVALKKSDKNKKTLDYLNSNPIISERSGWNKIKSMKYIDLLRAYFNSEEFEQSLDEVIKKENQNYINKYIFFAKTYITYFQSYNSNSTIENNSTSINFIPSNISHEFNYSENILSSIFLSNNNVDSQDNW
jgi:hypothetical protein